MRLRNCIVLLVVFLMAGCGGTEKMAISGAGSTDGDALISVGKVVSDTVEVGVTAVGFKSNIEGVDTAYAAGPYGVYLIPTTEDIAKDWQPFAGGAMLMSLDGELDFIPKIVAGVIYKPRDVLSPYYMAEKAFPSEDVDAPNIANRDGELYHWFGLRYRFR